MLQGRTRIRWQVSTNFITRFNEENRLNDLQIKHKKVFAIILVLLAVLIIVSGCTKNNTEDITAIETNDSPEIMKETVKVGNDGVNAAIAPDDVTIVSSQMEFDQNSGNLVSVTIEDTGRSDPFLPSKENIVSKPKPKMYNDLIPPPEAITVDTTATEVITTKVSGIMFDKFNPSAILNIAGQDYLVRTGDIINGYKVLSIGKEVVTVQYGANVYKAGVGEIFNGDGINFNTVSNLESKFGGRGNSSNRK